jgi:hypothetical protein
MRRAWFVFSLLACLPGVGVGQSILGTVGLGVRTEPLDAVQRALGGVGVGAGSATILPGDPTASLDLLAPTVSFSAQSTWGNYTFETEEADFQGTRFPILAVAYPLGIRSVLTVTAGSVFDQRWGAVSEGTLEILGEAVPIRDTFESDGGVSTLRVGYGRRLSNSLALGASVGLYRGHLDRSFVRSFNRELDSLDVVNQITPFGDAGRWTYSGPVASVSASWDPSEVVQLGASVGWSGGITGDPVGVTSGESIDVTPPLEIRLGVTTMLSPAISVTAGLSTADWTDLGDPAFDDLVVGRVTSYGGGIEWRARRFWAGDLPLRIGYRHSGLPFAFRGHSAVENTISGGFSIVMAQALGIPLATFDAAIEVGSRTAGELNEKFRRFTLTFRVGGR